ncbi:uncharacterized protein LOC134211082 isoform X1 [Armigeres subalbatus]|uniref:uncharacterized protein LOC134211082 isoform X1 n=2 Tax=Armigeres subalbatus TaxID=124917 RepID=UPI002ED3C1D0
MEFFSVKDCQRIVKSSDCGEYLLLFMMKGCNDMPSVLQPNSSNNVAGKSDFVEVITMPQYDHSVGLISVNMDCVVLGNIEDVKLVLPVHGLQDASFISIFPWRLRCCGDREYIVRDGWHKAIDLVDWLLRRPPLENPPIKRVLNCGTCRPLGSSMRPGKTDWRAKIAKLLF